MAEDSALVFPCDFPLKVLGHAQAGYVQAIAGVVKHHAPDFDASTVDMKPSRGGKYISVTCTIRAASREQLDALYRELCDHPMVVMVL